MTNLNLYDGNPHTWKFFLLKWPLLIHKYLISYLPYFTSQIMLHFYYKYCFFTDIVLTFYGTIAKYTPDSYNLHKLLQ